MTALAGAVLNSFQRFALPAVTPVLHNLAVIAAMLWLSPLLAVPISALAWGVLAAGVMQLVLLWPAMGRLGLRPRLRLDFRHSGVLRVGRLMLPTLFSSSVAQLNLIVGTMFASLLIDGSQSWLYYSDRLIEFPLGLFGVALATVILPHLSRRHADTDAEGYAAALDWGLRTVLLLAVPAALGLALLAEPMVVTIFERGEFDAGDARMTGLSLMAMSLGIPGFMASKVLLSAFYARQDTRTPMRAAVVTVFLNIALTAALGDAAVAGRRVRRARGHRPGHRPGRPGQCLAAVAGLAPRRRFRARARLGSAPAAHRRGGAGDDRGGADVGPCDRRLACLVGHGPLGLAAGRGRGRCRRLRTGPDGLRLAAARTARALSPAIISA